jgi:nitrite reductase/ring-hydroxylating ferredoxin subunit
MLHGNLQELVFFKEKVLCNNDHVYHARCPHFTGASSSEHIRDDCDLEREQF